MNEKILVDTNLWVYLFTKTPYEKYEGVAKIIDKHFATVAISVQIIGELYTVLVRKYYWERKG